MPDGAVGILPAFMMVVAGCHYLDLYMRLCDLRDQLTRTAHATKAMNRDKAFLMFGHIVQSLRNFGIIANFLMKNRKQCYLEKRNVRERVSGGLPVFL